MVGRPDHVREAVVLIVHRAGTFREAAAAIGVRQSTVHAWYHGHASPSPLAARAIEAACSRFDTVPNVGIDTARSASAK